MPFARPKHNPRRADTRPNATRRGYDAQHRKWRKLVLARDPICAGWPKGERCLQPSTVADHVVPISQGGARFDLANGAGLCASHHGAKSAWELREYGERQW